MNTYLLAYLTRRPIKDGFFIEPKETKMNWLAWLMVGGFLKGYRTQVLGVSAFFSALALFAVGDMSFVDLVKSIPMMFGGLALTALGAKVNTVAKTGDVK